MKLLICNDYDSCYNASILIVDKDYNTKEVENIKDYLTDDGCSINIYKVASELGGSEFKLIHCVDGYIEKIISYKGVN